MILQQHFLSSLISSQNFTLSSQSVAISIINDNKHFQKEAFFQSLFRAFFLICVLNVFTSLPGTFLHKIMRICLLIVFTLLSRLFQGRKLYSFMDAYEFPRKKISCYKQLIVIFMVTTYTLFGLLNLNGYYNFKNTSTQLFQLIKTSNLRYYCLNMKYFLKILNPYMTTSFFNGLETWTVMGQEDHIGTLSHHRGCVFMYIKKRSCTQPWILKSANLPIRSFCNYTITDQ